MRGAWRISTLATSRWRWRSHFTARWRCRTPRASTPPRAPRTNPGWPASWQLAAQYTHRAARDDRHGRLHLYQTPGFSARVRTAEQACCGHRESPDPQADDADGRLALPLAAGNQRTVLLDDDYGLAGGRLQPHAFVGEHLC